MIVNFTSVWLSHGVPRYSVKHYFWVCLWQCFWMGLAFKTIDCVKQIALPNLSEYHSTCWEPAWSSTVERGRIVLLFLCLTVWGGNSVFSFPWTIIYTISSPGSQASGLQLELLSQLSCVPRLPTTDQRTSQSP